MPATFESFVLSWLATVAVVRFKGSGYREYESICRRHLLPTFGDVPLENITTARIQDYVAEKLAGGLSARSVNNHIQALRRILEYAVTCGIVTRSPVGKVVLPRQERSEMRFLVPGELHRLIASTPPSWRLLVAMAALTGLRKGEQLALTFSDIDLDAGTIRVSRSMRDGTTTTPKTAASVSVIPLPESLSPPIAQRRRQVVDPDGLVFCRSDGSPLPDGLPNRILSRALESADLPPIRWHDLRHSWVAAHLQAGTDIPTLQRLGRWASPETLLRTYAHVLPASGGDAVAKLDRMIGENDR